MVILYKDKIGQVIITLVNAYMNSWNPNPFRNAFNYKKTFLLPCSMHH